MSTKVTNKYQRAITLQSFSYLETNNTLGITSKSLFSRIIISRYEFADDDKSNSIKRSIR